jgi:hypothetical protein
MDKRTELLTDQELADALQSAIWRAKRLSDHALARACKYAETLDAAGPVVVHVAAVGAALLTAHSQATAAALAMPGVAPAFGGKD